MACTELPAAIANADLSQITSILPNGTAIFNCKTGAKWSDGQTGSKTVTCNENGQWTSIAETCKG